MLATGRTQGTYARSTGDGNPMSQPKQRQKGTAVPGAFGNTSPLSKPMERARSRLATAVTHPFDGCTAPIDIKFKPHPRYHDSLKSISYGSKSCHQNIGEPNLATAVLSAKEGPAPGLLPGGPGGDFDCPRVEYPSPVFGVKGSSASLPPESPHPETDLLPACIQPPPPPSPSRRPLRSPLPPTDLRLFHRRPTYIVSVRHRRLLRCLPDGSVTTTADCGPPEWPLPLPVTVLFAK